MIATDENEMEFLRRMLNMFEERLRKLIRTVETGYADLIMYSSGTIALDVFLPPHFRHDYAVEATQVLEQIIKTRMLIIKIRHCEK